MSFQEGAGAGVRNRLTANLSAQSINPSNLNLSPNPAFVQAPARGGRLQRIIARASRIAHDEALRDTKRGLKAVNADERQELRASAAILTGMAKRLAAEADQ